MKLKPIAAGPREPGRGAQSYAFRRPDTLQVMVAGVAILLIATVLFQAPLAEVFLTNTSSRGVLVHSWDLVWLLLLAVATSMLFVHRRRVWAAIARRQVPWGDPITPLVVLTVFGVLSLVWVYTNFGSGSLGQSFEQCLRLAAVVILSLLVRSLADDRLRRTIVWSFLVAATIAAGWAVVAWKTERASLPFLVRTVSVGIARAGGPFGNTFSVEGQDHWWAAAGAPNILGFWLAVAIPVAVVTAWKSWSTARLSSILSLVSLLVLTVGLVATHSRESWLACVVALLILLWPRVRQLGLRRRIGLLVAVVGVVTLVAVLVPSVTSRLENSFRRGTFDYQTGPLARVNAWRAGLRWSWEALPLGWGIGAIEENPGHFQGRTTAENLYLQYLAQLGIVGFVALVAISIQGLRLGLRAARARADDPCSLFAAAFFAALIVHGMFGNTLGDPTVQILFACALGFCVPMPGRQAQAESFTTQPVVSAAPA